MKYTIALISILLTACGSSGGGGIVATSNTQPTSKKVLYIVDMPQNVTLAQDVMPGLGNVNTTVKYVQSYVDYVTWNGTALTGAKNSINAWLAADHYDAIVFLIGQQEYQNDGAGYPCYCPRMNQNQHASEFINAVLSDPNAPTLLIAIKPNMGGANLSGYTQILSINDGADANLTYQAQVSAVVSKLSQALQ